MKAVMISGDRSGSGKTSITLALASILSRGMKVQTFKVGMDYIDPSYLSAATGRPCRNLDSFVMDEREILDIFHHGCSGADCAIVEGVRGLYEGAESLGDTGSSAAIAKILDIPVVLVVNARSITRSAAALVKGFMAMDPGIGICGVILNNVSGEGHRRKATDAVEHFCGIPVIGTIPREPEMALAMRHLGLVPYLEGSTSPEFVDRVGKVTGIVGQHVDVEKFRGLFKDLKEDSGRKTAFSGTVRPDVRIGIALDQAFNFYYADIFDLLPALGAEIVTFSPVKDSLPDADGYIIGGGYPELFLPQLEENASMREALRERSRDGTPIYAECGGLMYLSERIVTRAGWRDDPEEHIHSMCGVFSGETIMPAKRVVSYVEGTSLAGSPMGESRFRGHEFHYSDVVLSPSTQYAYNLSRGIGISGGKDGALSGKTLGSYTHLHPISSRGMFRHFLDCCRGVV